MKNTAGQFLWLSHLKFQIITLILSVLNYLFMQVLDYKRPANCGQFPDTVKKNIKLNKYNINNHQLPQLCYLFRMFLFVIDYFIFFMAWE